MSRRRAVKKPKPEARSLKPVNPSCLVRRIHASPLRIVMATTGGGASALEALLAVPGASRTMLEGVVPYSAVALKQFLGAAPEHACSPQTARAMAMAAFQRALRLADDPPEAEPRTARHSPLATHSPRTTHHSPAWVGIGCTASLASDRPKKGAHRAHLAAQTAGLTLGQSIEFQKGRRSRLAEEQLLGRLLLNLVAEVAGLPERLPAPLLPGEELISSHTAGRPEWTELLLGQLHAVRQGPGAGSFLRRAVLPGAFNPRHKGHRQLAEVALRRLGGPDKARVEHEISILSVDKPPLDFVEMQCRAEQFGPQETLWFTAAPRFEQKADLFPGVTFLVGADTIVRIGDVRYYGGDPAARDRAVAHLAERECRFLVFGRLMAGRFCGLADLELPTALRALCDEIPGEEFRADISSTELRGQTNPCD